MKRGVAVFLISGAVLLIFMIAQPAQSQTPNTISASTVQLNIGLLNLLPRRQRPIRQGILSTFNPPISIRGKRISSSRHGSAGWAAQPTRSSQSRTRISPGWGVRRRSPTRRA